MLKQKGKEMEKLELANKEQIEIIDGSSLSSIQVEVSDLNAFKELCEKLTDDNLSQIRFLNESNNECSLYKDKILAGAGYKPVENLETGEVKLIATISLKDIDKASKKIKDLEKRLEETQTATEVLTNAIAEIGTLVGGE